MHHLRIKTRWSEIVVRASYPADTVLDFRRLLECLCFIFLCSFDDCSEDFRAYSR